MNRNRNPRCQPARPTRTRSRRAAVRQVAMSESRRGNELAEMSAALRAHAAKANPTKDQQHARRALFQRIIQYLTIGIDMSPLFSDVIMNAHTKDMATKKMLYHYLTHYAQAKADLALLTVNTLQKDCRDEDPVVRGLAVRSMASMRVPDLVEYLVRSRLARARARGRDAPHPHRTRLPAHPSAPPARVANLTTRSARTGPRRGGPTRPDFFFSACFQPFNPKTSRPDAHLSLHLSLASRRSARCSRVCRTRTRIRARRRRWAF